MKHSTTNNDPFFGNILLRVNGQNEVLIENYKGIVEYTQEKITLETKDCRVSFFGKKLFVSYYGKDEMKIIGFIERIQYEN